MRQFLFLIYSLIVLVSCSEVNAPSKLKLSIANIQEIGCSSVIYPINEIYNPSDIYSIGDYLVVVNNNKKCNVLYLYRRDNMMFDRTFGLYGRAGNEYLFTDRSPKINNDSTLYLYTNFVDCSEFQITSDSIREISKRRITDDIRNNVIILNDSLVFYRALQSDCAFTIYNYKQKRNMLSFGNFPISSIKYKNDADRDNICVSSSVYSPNRGRLVSFYESLPLVRIFDTNAYECIQEIELMDVQKQISSLDGYYEDKNIVYFSRPIVTSTRIYVSLINNCADFIPESTTLLGVDWTGNMVAKYVIDKFCPIYTVTETGEFYGITYHENSMMLCKAKL